MEHHGSMSILRRVSEPVRVPVRHAVHHQVTFFEDLIHEVKSELVSKLDEVNSRLDALERQAAVNGDVMADQLALHTSRLRAVSTEVERLQNSLNQSVLGPGEMADRGVLDLAASAEPSGEPSTSTHP